jgi:hypothetical protein
MYSILLFLHIVGAFGLFSTLAFEQAGLFNLRRAETNVQAREWLALMRAPQRIQGPSALILLATGLYMMATRWPRQAWAGLGLVGMVVMAIIGIAVTARRMKAIGRHARRRRPASVRASRAARRLGTPHVGVSARRVGARDRVQHVRQAGHRRCDRGAGRRGGRWTAGGAVYRWSLTSNAPARDAAMMLALFDP